MKKSRPRKNNALSITRTAEALVVGNAITEATMGGNIVESIFGVHGGMYNPGADGGNKLSVAELLGFTASGWKAENVGGRYGTKAGSGTSFLNAVMNNLKANGVKSMITIGVTPIVFRVLRKQGRGFSRMFNKIARDVGIPVRF
tara:strand:+ start:1238 stop:1669 length:432 start_codon:yes stop_codon:yes gene_type:complete